MRREVGLGDAAAPRLLGPLTRTDFVRYQGASGDFQAIHHDEPYALAAGFPAPIAVGMLTAGALGAWATDWLGPENVRRVAFRFRAPAFPGDVLELHGRVVNLRTGESGETLADLELTATHTAGTGAVAVAGEATFMVRAATTL